MKVFSAACLLSVAGIAHAQADPVVATILAEARERMVHQNDVWFKDGQYPRVIQNLKILCNRSPHDEQSWSDLCWMLGNVEAYDEQLVTAIKWKQNNPDYVDGPYYEAQFYFTKKAYTRVVSLLEPVLKMKGRPDANNFRMLANSYRSLGLMSEAIRVWKAMLVHYPNDPYAKLRIEQLGK